MPWVAPRCPEAPPRAFTLPGVARRKNRFQTALADDLVLSLVPQRFAWPWDEVVRGKFWGIFATAIFLSLGAPFWFNLLKNLSNLRPILASKQKAENAHSTG